MRIVWTSTSSPGGMFVRAERIDSPHSPSMLWERYGSKIVAAIGLKQGPQKIFLRKLLFSHKVKPDAGS